MTCRKGSRMTIDIDRTIDSYLQFWNSEEDDQRRIGGGLFANDVSYHAIVGVLTGVDALVDFRAQLIENVGEVRFQARQPADQHHDPARPLWGSEGRRLGKECVRTCEYRWWPDHSKKNNK